ncbi:hypothetical protein EV360DRAFT_86757 [Lentinula raphanica]|nr:hypothetical protein EV360DRAFT_86757 [Lentinula raphanica]
MPFLGSTANLVGGQTLGDLYLSNPAENPILHFGNRDPPQHFRLVQNAALFGWNGITIERSLHQGPLHQCNPPGGHGTWQKLEIQNGQVYHPLYQEVRVINQINIHVRTQLGIPEQQPPWQPAMIIPVLAGGILTPMFFWNNQFDTKVRLHIPNSAIFYCKHVDREPGDHGSNDFLDMEWFGRRGPLRCPAVLYKTQWQSARLTIR